MSTERRIEILHEAKKQAKDGEFLCLQYVAYPIDENSSKNGYRFIWRTTDGKLRALRGQARIPSLAVVLELISLAMSEGWGNFDDMYF